MKEFGSTLEVRGLKDRTQSLSNVDILISPCSPNLRPSGQSDAADAGVDKPAEKTRLEAAVSFPLERSKVTQHLSSPTLSRSSSSTVFCPDHRDLEGRGAEEQEQGGDAADSNHGNGGGEEPEDRTYPTLRSKSLNVNPRKTRKKESEEKPRSAGSVRDLVSAFSEGAAGTPSRTRTRSRDSDS